jgi:PilZ domain
MDARPMNMPVSPKSLEAAEKRARDSLFLLAELELEGSQATCKVKVRNLSPGGMMVESDLAVAQGQRIIATLRNIGPVSGQIAWARKDRFGVAFDREIDPKLARHQVGNSAAAPRYLRTPTARIPSFPR